MNIWLISFIAFLQIHALENSVMEVNNTETTSWLDTLQSNLRIRYFSETMLPALNFHSNAIPTPASETGAPMNTFNIIWADYKLTSYLRLAYHQRFTLFYSRNHLISQPGFINRSPRFSLRFTDVFPMDTLLSLFDLYYQPGWSHASNVNGILHEIGARIQLTYLITNWQIGFITEWTKTFLKSGYQTEHMYGWTNLWGSYQINTWLFTQHSVTATFQQKFSKKWAWDSPGEPYIQNGVGIVIGKNTQVNLFLNNFLLSTPKLSNTWASIWISYKFL